MKIKKNYMMRKVAGNCVVVPMGEEVTNFNGMINLNETGEILFEKLQKGCDKEELAEVMMEEYEVTRDVCEKDIDRFVEKLRNAGILEE